MSFLFSQTTTHPQRLNLLKAIPLLLLITSISARAQSGGKFDTSGTGGQHMIHGRIYLPAQHQEGLIIKVKIESTNSTRLSVVDDADGAFTFRNLEARP